MSLNSIVYIKFTARGRAAALGKEKAGQSPALLAILYKL